MIRKGQDVFVLSPGNQTYLGAKGYLTVVQNVEQVAAGPYSVYTGKGATEFAWQALP